MNGRTDGTTKPIDSFRDFANRLKTNTLYFKKLYIGNIKRNLKTKIYRTIILPVVLYGCEAWSLTAREERKLRVFENMVLRRIFGPRRDEVTGEWRRLHNEELNCLYSSPNIVRVIKAEKNEMGWACGSYGGGEGGV